MTELIRGAFIQFDLASAMLSVFGVAKWCWRRWALRADWVRRAAEYAGDRDKDGVGWRSPAVARLLGGLSFWGDGGADGESFVRTNSIEALRHQ